MLLHNKALPILGLSAALLGGPAFAGFQRTLTEFETPFVGCPLVQTAATVPNVSPDADTDLPDDYSLGLFQALGGTTQVKPKLRVANAAGFDQPSGRLGGGGGGWSSLGGLGGIGGIGGGGAGAFGGGVGTGGGGAGSSGLAASVPVSFTPLPNTIPNGSTAGGGITSPFTPETPFDPPFTVVSPPGLVVPSLPAPDGDGGSSGGVREGENGSGGRLPVAPGPSGVLLFVVGALSLTVVTRIRHGLRAKEMPTAERE